MKWGIEGEGAAYFDLSPFSPATTTSPPAKYERIITLGDNQITRHVTGHYKACNGAEHKASTEAVTHVVHGKRQGGSGETSKKVVPSPSIPHSTGFSERVKEVKDRIANGMC